MTFLIPYGKKQIQFLPYFKKIGKLLIQLNFPILKLFGESKTSHFFNSYGKKQIHNMELTFCESLNFQILKNKKETSTS